MANINKNKINQKEIEEMHLTSYKTDKDHGITHLGHRLRKHVREELVSKNYSSITIVCIGTDRSSGDSLGPFVGKYLKERVERKTKCFNINVVGDMENPVHAKNLHETVANIPKNSYVIAVDACLGLLDNIGKIHFRDKPLRPGAAMNKDLPKVGNLSITGIVNISGGLEFMILQNTRLFEVLKLADKITNIVDEYILKDRKIQKILDRPEVA